MKQGLLLFAHGARDPRWAQPFEEILARIRTNQPALELELAFLENMSPSLSEATKRLVSAGCQQIAVLPLFLGAGGHVLNDLPAVLSEARTMYPFVQWRTLPAIGEIDTVQAAIACAAVELLTNPSKSTQ